MAAIAYQIPGTCTASMGATGALRKGAALTCTIAPGTGRISADQSVFTFEGHDFDGGCVRAEARASAVKAFFILVEHGSSAKLAKSICLIVAGAIIAIVFYQWISFLSILGGGVLVAVGAVLVYAGLAWHVEFSVQVTESFTNLFTISMRTNTSLDGFKEFVDSFWAMALEVAKPKQT